MKVKYIKGKFKFTQKHIRALCLFDIHAPFNLFFDSLLKLMRTEKFDIILLGGDAINNDPFNHWAKTKPKLLKEMPLPQAYFTYLNKTFFKPLRAAAGKATIIYMLGNHEGWSRKAVDMIPEGEGYFEIENNVEGIDFFVREKEMMALGDLWFAHGDNVPFGKNQHAKKVPLALQRNIMFGHYHDFEVHSLAVPVDRKPIIGISVPCLTNTNPCSYGKNLPNNRTHGFAWVNVNNTGEFDWGVVQIKQGKFYFNNKIYESKQTKPKKLGYQM